MESMKNLLDLEKRIKKAIKDCSDEIVENTKAEEMPGVKKISDSPKVAIITLSAMSREGVWDPSYYSQSAQAEAVGKALGKCTSIATFIKTLEKIIKEKKVSYCSWFTVRMNSKTIEVLESALNDIKEGERV